MALLIYFAITVEAGTGFTSLRQQAKMNGGGEKQKSFSMQGNGATYATGADSVPVTLVPTAVEPGVGADEGVVKMEVAETEEEKRKREKREKKERRKSEKSAAAAVEGGEANGDDAAAAKKAKKEKVRLKPLTLAACVLRGAFSLLPECQLARFNLFGLSH